MRKNIGQIFTKAVRYVDLYRQNIFVRVVADIVIIFTFYILYEFNYDEVIYFSIIIFSADYFTLNMIFVRDFYPANLFAEKIYPDKNGIGNKLMYLFVYLWYVYIVIIMLHELFKN